MRTVREQNEFYRRMRLKRARKARQLEAERRAADHFAKHGKHFELEADFFKADQRLGIVFGWAIVCKEDGEDYFDTQGDHIPEDAMLKATAEFMAGKRTMKVMHKGRKRGTVLFAFPMTTDIAKALGIESDKSGLLIGVKPDDKSVLDKFASGEFTGFSIGGYRGVDKEVDE